MGTPPHQRRPNDLDLFAESAQLVPSESSVGVMLCGPSYRQAFRDKLPAPSAQCPMEQTRRGGYPPLGENVATTKTAPPANHRMPIYSDRILGSYTSPVQTPFQKTENQSDSIIGGTRAGSLQIIQMPTTATS